MTINTTRLIKAVTTLLTIACVHAQSDGAYGNVGVSYEPHTAATTGAILLQQQTPGEQQADVDVVGPDGYWEHIDFAEGEGYTLEALEPGIYSVSASDEGLELVHDVVEVRAGEVAVIRTDFRAWDETLDVGGYNPKAYAATVCEGEDEAYPGYPCGAYSTPAYSSYGPEDVGSLTVAPVPPDHRTVVTGPNGYSEAFDNDVLIRGLPPGIYAIAITGEGADISVATVAVKGGEALTTTPTPR